MLSMAAIFANFVMRKEKIDSMSRLTDFLSMSKHERRGAIALLLMVGAVVAMFFANRCVRSDNVVVDRQKVESFDQQTDSAVKLMNRPRQKKKAKSRKTTRDSSATKSTPHKNKKGKRAAEKRSGKSAPQRDLDREVPRY